MNDRTKIPYKNIAAFFSVPFAIMFILFVVFFINGLYPFGNGTIAWCDMTQQVIPMTADLKDILTGKTSLFLNMQNAGGMSMVGVIFFFVASPFNLLALFVPKEDLIYFVNIATMLKMMTAGVTAMLFFRKCLSKTDPFISACLSVSYAFCGYTVLYYQNSIWLDIMYLFPLLMIGIHRLVTKNKMALYVAMLSLMAVVNYYICYMIALFCILFIALLCIRDRKKERLQTAFLFIMGSMLSMLMTAVVWLPSLLQFFASGRTTSVTKNLQNANFLSEFQTALPLLLYSVCAIVICAGCVLDKKKHTRETKTMLIMLVLMLLPMIIEPVNLMWHTGSYMSFPCRFAFITVFFLLICSAMFLEDGSGHICEYDGGTNKQNKTGFAVVSVFVFLLCAFLVKTVMNKNADIIDLYARRLWSDDKSFSIEAKVFALTAAGFGTVFYIYKKGKLNRNFFAAMLGCFVVLQAVSSTGMYMTGSKDQALEKTVASREVFKLEGKIHDDDFYRVKTAAKQFDVNNIGALGYRSISHYTSLTNKNYMYAMKKLGYSSYWMEVGSHGGTELTDALFSIKYQIGLSDDTLRDSVYMSQKYGIYKRTNTVGLGLVTDRDISSMESLDDMDRFEVQQNIYTTLFSNGPDDKLMTKYEPDATGRVLIREDEDGLIDISPMSGGSDIDYHIDVKGKQVLYFDCFNKPSSNLNEPEYSAFTISVDGLPIKTGFPSQSSNGLLWLGEFSDRTVEVTVRVEKNVECTSFGVYGLDLNKLSTALENAKCAGLKEEKGVISGEYTAQKGEKCLVFIPYSESLRLEINGQEAKLEKAFGDFVAFDLQPGENSIRITNMPFGISAGIALSLFGIAACLGIWLFGKKIKLDNTVYVVFRVVAIVAGAAVLAGIYIYPVLVNCFGKKR